MKSEEHTKNEEKNEELQETFEEIQQNDLDDIVLEKFEKKEKKKRLLLFGGLTVLIFLIVIAIVKLSLDASSAPQDKLIEAPLEAQKQPSSIEDDYVQVPIVGETSTPKSEASAQKEDDVDRAITEILHSHSPATVAAAHQPSQKVSTPQKPQPSQPKEPTPSKSTLPAHTTPSQTHSAPKKAKQHTQPAKKHTPKKMQQPSRHGHYYIQVAAFLQYAPDKEFLQKIEKLHLHYIIKELHMNGKHIRRVYVGPFASKAQARKALRRVRAHIAKGAFITKVR